MTEPSELRAAFTIAKAMSQSALPQTTMIALPSTTTKLLRPPRRRSFVIPISVFVLSALLAGYGTYRLEPVRQREPQPQIKTALDDLPPPKQQGESSISRVPPPQQSLEPADLRSFALDVAHTYIALSKAKMAADKGGNTQKAP